MRSWFGISLCALCFGCASICSESEYVQRLEASEDNVVVDIEKNGAPYQSEVPVPAEIKLPADNGFFSRATYSFTFKKEGFKDKVLTRSAKVDPLYWVNFATGTGIIIGMLIVDPWTGAMWSLEDAPLVAVLKRDDATAKKESARVVAKPSAVQNDGEARSVAQPATPAANVDRKCARCGVAKDANGKCPLCDQ